MTRQYEEEYRRPFLATQFPIVERGTRRAQRKAKEFDDRDLTIADLASMAQQGKRSLRKIPKAWKVK